MDSLISIGNDIRIFMYGGLISLPLTIAGSMVLLGLFTGNYAMLFFLIGFLLLTPLASYGIDLLFVIAAKRSGSKIFDAYMSDICKLNAEYIDGPRVEGAELEPVVASSWVAMISFFIGYLVTNAIKLHNYESIEESTESKDSKDSTESSRITNRKSQAIIAIVAIIIFSAIALMYRYKSGCESKAGMIPTSLLFGWAGYGWYKLQSCSGDDRLADLFGIANRLLQPEATNNGPIACVPILK